MGSLKKRSVGTDKKVGMALAGAGSLASFFALGGTFGIILGIGLLVVVGVLFKKLLKDYAENGRRF